MGVVGALSAFVCMIFLPGLGVCAVAAETSAATLSACLSMRLLPHTPHAIAPESRRTTTIPCLPPGKRFTNAAVLEQDGVCSAIGAFAWSGGPVRQPALRMHSLFPSTFSPTPLQSICGNWRGEGFSLPPFLLPGVGPGVGCEAPAPVLVPLGPWLYSGSPGRVAGNGLPFPNPRTPLPALAPTGRMWWPGLDCPPGPVPRRLVPLD